MKIQVKRVYEPAHKDDGYRVLIDRLWPRGIKKEELNIDQWRKEVAPTTQLRKWFSHDPNKFKEFSNRYIQELESSEVPQELLKQAQNYKKITLLYATKDPEINHAVILKKYLESL